ncbi:MAG: phosphodiester glycosidase family protein [Fimbriimonadaceae bacterium]|nr:phosphodiester glycosidase family protein [Fimbriimonadaceae bacterium]
MIALLTACVLATPAPPVASPIAYEKVKIGKATYHVVTANLKSGRVAAETVHWPKLTSVWNLISKSKPSAAITGTFFAYDSQRPVADVLVDGELLSMGSLGTAIAVDWYGKVTIFDIPKSQKVDWGLYRYGLRGTVRVVTNGKVQPNPQAQKFKDKRLWGKAARTGIGVTTAGKLLLIATTNQVSLTELGQAMTSRKVKNGISLDGGGSTCLYFKGNLVVPTSRPLNNMFLVREVSEGFDYGDFGGGTARQ